MSELMVHSSPSWHKFEKYCGMSWALAFGLCMTTQFHLLISVDFDDLPNVATASAAPK